MINKHKGKGYRVDSDYSCLPNVVLGSCKCLAFLKTISFLTISSYTLGTTKMWLKKCIAHLNFHTFFVFLLSNS